MVRKCKSRVIPEQNKKICGGICLCQMIVVFSCVSLVYLTVVVYMPSHRAFNSGFEETPVMCETWNTTMLNNCNWASCGEWCLTKTSGFCPQIHVIVRRNGTDVTLEDCTTVGTVACPPVDVNKMHRFNCNNGSECSTLTGLFNCSLGHCANLSEPFMCHYKRDSSNTPLIDSEKDNMKLNGFFHCNMSRCAKLKRPFTCDRYCKLINTIHANVYIAHQDTLITAQCKRAYATNECNGTEEGFPIAPTTIWSEKPDEVLFSSCSNIEREGSTLRATDCTNGALFSFDNIPKPTMNFTTYWGLVQKSMKSVLDPQQRFLPLQSSLTIYNNSRLYINLEGCVNTLQGECKQFLYSHGRDGKNQTATSRFPCYFNKNNSFFVIARFNLKQVWKELIIAISVPAVLFVISFITLCIVTQSVRVGDDTKMRCKCCMETPTADSDLQNATLVDEETQEAETSDTKTDQNNRNCC